MHLCDRKTYQDLVVAVAHNEFLKIDFQPYKDQGTVLFDAKACIDKNLIDCRLC